MRNERNAKVLASGFLIYFSLTAATSLVTQVFEYNEAQNRAIQIANQQKEIEAAKAAIATKDIEKAIQSLDRAVGLTDSPQKKEAEELLQECKAATSEWKVRSVLAAMTDQEFTAFVKKGAVPHKTYLSDPTLNAIFIANLKDKRTEATEIRAAARASSNVDTIVRRQLHANLDGKLSGLVVDWEYDSEAFTVIIDGSKYEQNSIMALGLTIRSIFESNNAPFPKQLIFKSKNGSEYGRGPFSNIPSLVQ